MLSEASSTALVIKNVAIPLTAEVHKQLVKRGGYDAIIDLFLRRNPHHILIFGASGTGKSSLLESLQGYNAAIDRMRRTETPQSLKGKIEKVSFDFVDMPGQSNHRDLRTQAINEVIRRRDGRPLGIINVVSHGFHEGKGAAQDALSHRKAREEYLAARRATEISLLDEWTSRLCGRGGEAAWLVTVVTKADLWWSAEADQAVLKYYTEGEYASALGDAKGLPNYVCPYSSLNQLFYSEVPMTGYYTDNERRTHHGDLIATILSLAAHAEHKEDG